jgi:hypothetical protein
MLLIQTVIFKIASLLTNFIQGVIFEVFTAVIIKNGVFWDGTLCGSCKNRRFGGTHAASVADYS